MTASALNRPTDRPPRQQRMALGTTLSVLAHAGLVGGLWWGVHWHASPTPEGSTAELWAAVPQVSAPPPEPARAPAPAPVPTPAPAPPPVEAAPKPPDIVTDKLQREQKAREDAEKLAAQKAAQDKAREDADKQKALDAQRLDKLRKEQLARVMGQLGAPADSTGADARTAGPSADYLGRVVAILKRNAVQTADVPGNPAVDVDIRCAPDGTIISRRIVKPSGSQTWDDIVLRAIDKTQVLPRDTDGRAPSVIQIRWHFQD